MVQVKAWTAGKQNRQTFEEKKRAKAAGSLSNKKVEWLDMWTAEE
jgi:hypothetical protein